MRSFGWALFQYDWSPHKRREVWTQRQMRVQGEHVRMKTEVGVMHLPAEGSQRCQQTQEAGGEAWERCALTTTEGTGPLETSVWDF